MTRDPTCAKKRATIHPYYLDRSTVRPIEIEPMEIGIDRKSYFAKTADRRPIEDRIIQDRTITIGQRSLNLRYPRYSTHGETFQKNSNSTHPRLELIFM